MSVRVEALIKRLVFVKLTRDGHESVLHELCRDAQWVICIMVMADDTESTLSDRGT